MEAAQVRAHDDAREDDVTPTRPPAPLPKGHGGRLRILRVWGSLGSR